MNTVAERTAVFVGCARDCAVHLDQVLDNIERMAALYAKAAFIFVENDSQDDTRARILHWLAPRTSGRLLQLDGLAATEPNFTARLALARNNYLACLRNTPYADYDDLIVMDFDEVNATALDVGAFGAAVEFLHADERTVGVFANSSPVYYDIWALRHPTWCPNDCWAEVEAAKGVSAVEATERFVRARQIAIDPGDPPIEVTSAFGGLGIYRLAHVLPQQYAATASDGSACCEHVSLNLALSRSGRLFIFPPLRNLAPPQHLRTDQIPARQLTLEQDGRTCVLFAPPEHRLDVYRAAHPLYDRRLPLLSRIIASTVPGCTIIDVGANIGDTVALCRLAGCDAPFIAVEPSAQYFAFLEANRRALPELFKDVRTVRAFIGAERERLSLIESAGTARGEVTLETTNLRDAIPTMPLSQVADKEISLVKIDTDGYDAAILLGSVEFLHRARPVIWAEAEVSSPADEQNWAKLCDDLARTYARMCIFDNFGFLVAHGPVGEKQATFLDLIRYTRRRKAIGDKEAGPATIYYLDVVFFPTTKLDVYAAFVSALIESDT